MANETPKNVDIGAALMALAEGQKALADAIAKQGADIALALGAGKASRPEKARKFSEPLAEAHKGTKTYVIGAGGHFRNNRLYRTGDLITVTDERPAKDWKLASPEQQKVKPAVKNPGRAADQNVG